MPKRFKTKIGPRDFEILASLDRVPLTSSQLCYLSKTFEQPFHDEHNLRRRLRRLVDSGLIRSWSYALVSSGRAPQYFKLTRDGYRLLHGQDASLPRRRYFEEISHGHHFHTNALAEFVTRIAVTSHEQGIALRHFARENSVKFEANGFTLFPDCAFQLSMPDGRVFNFVVELDNGTERVRSKQDVESLERKVRGYDAHQSGFQAGDPQRYLVLFVTTRSEQRMANILNLADAVMSNRQRTVFLAACTTQLSKSCPNYDAVWTDHRRLKRSLVPISEQVKKQGSCLTQLAAS